MPRFAPRARIGGRRLPVVAAGLAMLLLAGCGGSGSAAPETGTLPTPTVGSLSVSPAHPTTHSTITFGFRAPVATGVHGKDEISYSLSVTGRAGRGCVGAHEAGSPTVARGARTSVRLGPTQLGAPWCSGTYNAREIELRSAHCTGSAPCPQFIAVVGIVARAAFTVTRR